MSSENFAFWLQGFFELTNVTEIDANQTDLIKRHLNMVFKHDIDPKMGDDTHQQELNQIHNNPTGSLWRDNEPLMRC